MIGFGGDYNPEQWGPPTWAEDDVLMRRARVTTVTVGVFSWACTEPSEGRFDFAWLDETLARLHANGVAVTLATPTASPPPWFTLAHPDAMPVTAEGVTLSHGSRDTYCAAAPAYRAAAVRITSELAARYASHPAVTRWHVHNEYGTLCWCDHAAAAFRRWLRARYGESLGRLNDAWYTAFWSQRYSSWDQILPPRATQYLPNPGQVLDFKRFWSAELLAAYREQRDQIRRHAPGAEITTNFMLPDGWQVLDLWRWSREVDVVAIDHYLSSPDEAAAHADIALAADRARSLGGGRPWVLMEQAASTVNSGGVVAHRAPGRTLLDSLAYLARGADDVLFFQWRASRGGSEMFHAALVPHPGPDSRIFAEAVELGETLDRIGEVAGSVVRADVAILYDADSWWALETPSLPSDHLRYIDQIRAAHAAMWRARITTDLAHPEADLSPYRLVIAPATYILSDAAADALRHYVAEGGHLVATFLTGIADASHRIRLGGYPGVLREILGIRVEEFHPLRPGAVITLDDGSVGTQWSELLRPEGAEVVARYAPSPAAAVSAITGHPAITRHTFGAGTAWYVSTSLARPDDLVSDIARAAGVSPALHGLPTGVDAVRRHAPDSSYLFAFNHGPDPVVLPVTGTDLLTGRAASGAFILPPSAAAVIRERAKH
jgi:beta-galactosidase